ncbi:MAG: hypothetical protein M1830_001475 [Pleopsidium flavum]|nr:MAG: hypothetical protein M1830_001475 [Pleopsidium flavum]
MAGRMSTFVGNRHGIPTPAQSSANAASDMPPPTVDSRRQAAAAQARISTPLTKLEDRPSASAFNQPERRTYSPAPPPNDKLGDIARATQEQFESQNGNGDGFGTDLEGVDDTTTLSNIQVKDSQAEAQGRGDNANTWDTRQPNQNHYYGEEQEEYDHEDIQMEYNEERYTEGTDDEEVSGSEEEDTSGNEAIVSENDATVRPNISAAEVNRAVLKMKAEKGELPLTSSERRKAGSTTAPLQSQNGPKPAGHRHLGTSRRQAPGRAQHGMRTNGFHHMPTSWESDIENETDYNTLGQAQIAADPPSRRHKGRKQRKSQPQVDHILQTSQTQELPRRTKQQLHQVTPSRSMKQEQSSQLHKPDLRLNHQDSRAESPRSGGNANEIDLVDDVELNLSDAKNDEEIDEHNNANAQAIDGHLPEEPRANSKKRPLELDYDPETLRTMDYSDLKAQPFDSNPHAPPSVLPDNLSTASLPDKLQHVTTLPNDQRTQFFSSLTMTEWEDSGDWFVERFTDLVKRMKEARQAKRKLAMEFEEEITRREEAVRKAKETVEGELKTMKKGGEEVLKSKVS